MIHECLLRLWACPTGASAQDTCDHLFELEEFLHPGERSLLQEIVQIAMDYHKINTFNRSVLNRMPEESQEHQMGGLYITAFCNGVHKVLDEYRNEIIRLEDMFLHTPQLPLTFILSTVETFRYLFQTLLSLIRSIQEENVYGCLLIGKLHRFINCGVDNIVSAAEVIITSMNMVFYGHLCNWIIYGHLVDTNEFFIMDGKEPDEDFLYPEQLLELKDEKSSQIKKKSKIRLPPVVRRFYIKWEMVPQFINDDMAENILFIGRTVWIIMNDPKSSSCDKTQILDKRDIWEGKESEYYTKIQELESKPFNQQKFQNTLELCRNKLTKYLWSLMLTEGNLLDHLQLIRDYYVLGRGELFKQFITVAEEHIRNTSTESAIHILNSIFYETARKIYGENDKSYLKFELAVNCSSAGANSWSLLKMNFDINWPLHIVFHPRVITLYNKLFSFLLRLRKTQIDLSKLWAEHIFRKQKVERRVWMLRQNLIFLVNTLQYYFQVDIIEAQFSLLLEAVKNANEFEDIIKVHHEFITNLLSKTFVLTLDEDHIYKHKHKLYQVPAVHFDTPSQVYNVIIRLLEFCDEFCSAASMWSAELLGPDMKHFESFQERSDIIVETLLTVIFKLHEKLGGQHLLQLLLQLDFNKYFSKNKPDLMY